MPNKPNIPKDHHYVPAFYLKGFSDRKQMLHVYFKKDENVSYFSTNPRGILFEKHRHSFVNPDGSEDHGTFEKLFDENIERKTAPLLRSDDLPKIINDVKSAVIILNFMVHLIKRGDSFWEEFTKSSRYKNYFGQDSNLEKMARYNSSLQNKDTVKYIIENFDRIVIRSTDDLPFVTGDNPIFTGIPGSKPRYLSGLKNEYIEIYFPLNQHFCLVLMKNIPPKFIEIVNQTTHHKNAIREVNRNIIKMCSHTIISPSVLPKTLTKQIGSFKSS